MFKSKLMLVTLLMLCMPGLAISGVKMGKVDIQKVILTVKQGKKIHKELKDFFSSKQKVLKKEEADIRKMQKDFQKQALVLNDKARLKKEREIQGKVVKLQEKMSGYQKELQTMEQKKKKPVLDKVYAIINEISKAKKLDMTFEVNTSPVVYVKDITDITDDVIASYDKKHK